MIRADKREIKRLLNSAEVIASEPYPDPTAAVIYLIEILKLMNREDDSD